MHNTVYVQRKDGTLLCGVSDRICHFFTQSKKVCSTYAHTHLSWVAITTCPHFSNTTISFPHDTSVSWLIHLLKVFMRAWVWAFGLPPPWLASIPCSTEFLRPNINPNICQQESSKSCWASNSTISPRLLLDSFPAGIPRSCNKQMKNGP